MLKLLRIIRDAIAKLADAGKSEIDGKSRKKLREIYIRLRSNQAVYFRRLSNRVLPCFARDIHKLYRLLQELAPIFRRTIRNEDAEICREYRHRLVRSKIHEPARSLRLNFTYEVMKEKLLSASHRDLMLREIDENYQRYLESLSQTEFARNDDLFDELERLASLVEYDYQALLILFDPNIDLRRQSYFPRFAAVPSEKLIHKLQDLYFVLAPVHIPFGLDGLIYTLLSSQSGASVQSQEKIKGILRNIKDLLREIVSREILADLIRCIQEDPDFPLKCDESSSNYIAEYMSGITDRFERSKERCVREELEERISRDFFSLLGNIELLEIRGYSREEEEMLLDVGFDGLTYAIPLRILKSYLVARYEKICLKAVIMLELRGLFENADLKERLTDARIGCEDTLENINRFEEDISGVGSFSISAVRDLLDKYRQGERVNMEINTIIDALNIRVRKLIDQGSGYFYKLGRVLKDVLDDYRLPTPACISNIRTIGGDVHREFITALIRSHNDIVKLIGIMKNFTVMDAETFVREHIDDGEQ